MSRFAILASILVLGLGPLVTATAVTAKPKPGKAPIELETGLLPTADDAARSRGGDDDGRPSVKDRYIVVLEAAAGDPKRFAERLAPDGVVPTHIYRHVFNGFAARIPAAALAALKRDPDVLSVTPDRVSRVAAQTLPTGVDRIDADLNGRADIDGNDTRVDIDIAILDTGVASHPDLNLYALANCVSGSTNNDNHGHGTAVAGVAAALDNNVGVVGVAPGARIWSVKVLGDSGSGTESSIICGIDFVTAVAPGTAGPLGDIEVANASLEGTELVFNSPCAYAVHEPWCDAVAAGVTVVAAAGNNFIDAERTYPATYDEVIAVSALADSDGRPGGEGPATPAGRDDRFYSDTSRPVGSSGAGSNYGADIDIAAPGVDIRTTVPTTGNACCSDPSGYKKLTGTSFAAPHVAGAAALYLAIHGQVSPAAVKAGLLAEREQYAIPGDPDGINEGVVNVASPDITPPTVAIAAPKQGATVKKGATIKLNAKDTGRGVKSVEVRYCKGAGCDFAAGKPIGTAAKAPYAVKWAKPPKNGIYTLVARATDKAGNVTLSAPVTVRVKN